MSETFIEGLPEAPDDMYVYVQRGGSSKMLPFVVEEDGTIRVVSADDPQAITSLHSSDPRYAAMHKKLREEGRSATLIATRCAG